MTRMFHVCYVFRTTYDSVLYLYIYIYIHDICYPSNKSYSCWKYNGKTTVMSFHGIPMIWETTPDSPTSIEYWCQYWGHLEMLTPTTVVILTMSDIALRSLIVDAELECYHSICQVKGEYKGPQPRFGVAVLASYQKHSLAQPLTSNGAKFEVGKKQGRHDRCSTHKS